MKKLLLNILIVIAICSCSSSKQTTETERITSENSYLTIPLGSNNFIKVKRENHGRIKSKDKLMSYLQKELNLDFNLKKPLVILYYPGKDLCNSSGSQDISYDWLEKKLYENMQTKPIYIYKDSGGLERYANIEVWHKDPGGIIERLFFEHHYPCSSFVVIGKNGEFISYFGEFSTGYVLKAAEILNNKALKPNPDESAFNNNF